MKWILLTIIVVLASLSGFAVHLMNAEWLPDWIATHTANTSLSPSWDVRYLAAVTSAEYGLAGMVIYHLSRKKLIGLGTFRAASAFSILLAGIHASVVRQPIMDYAIGNPITVVLVQNGFKLLTWVIMGFVIVYGYEIATKSANKPLKNDAEKRAF